MKMGPVERSSSGSIFFFLISLSLLVLFCSINSFARWEWKGSMMAADILFTSILTIYSPFMLLLLMQVLEFGGRSICRFISANILFIASMFWFYMWWESTAPGQSGNPIEIYLFIVFMITSILSAIPKEYSFLAPFREKRSGVGGGVDDGNGISGVVDGDLRVSRKMATIEEEEEEEEDDDNDNGDEENNDGDDEDEDD